jgi:hypothetical protein
MDTSSKQQRTYEESERERERELEEKWKKQTVGNWKLKSLKKGRRTRTRKKVCFTCSRRFKANSKFF